MADQHYQNHPLPPPPPSHSQGNQYAEESYDYRYQQQSQQQYPEQQYQPQQQYQQQPYQQQPTSPVSPSHQQVQAPAQAHASPNSSTGHPQRQASKPRTFSFQSNKSQKSNGSHHKIDTHETHAEKEAKRLHSKADPTMAISEAEPAAVQAMTKNSLAPLRSIQHRDSYGNTIAEPDRSNPTRSRWERPLDTIRSFEAAIDGGYSRKSFIRQDSDNSASNWNRRNSYYGNNGARFPQDSYYGSRPMSMIRSDSSNVDFGRGQRGSFYEGPQANGDSYTHSGNGQGYGYGPGSSRQRTPRMMSEPMPAFREQQQQQIYPLPHKDRSYETVTTAAGSGSSDQAGYQTDPTSSDNSSVHRTSPPKRQEPVNDYGIGFNQSSSFQPAGFNVANGARNAGPNGQAQQRGPPPPPHGQVAPPQVPPKNGNVLLRKQVSPAAARPEPPEKRKSWFSRRFSKNS